MAPAASTGLIQSAANQAYCIDAAQDRDRKRAPVRLFTCHGGDNQRWAMAPDVSGATTVVGIGGLCLDLHGPQRTEGATAQLSACTGESSQKLHYDSSGRLRDLASGKCLTVTKAARGAPILVLPCDPGNPGQVWSVSVP